MEFSIFAIVNSNHVGDKKCSFFAIADPDNLKVPCMYHYKSGIIVRSFSPCLGGPRVSTELNYSDTTYLLCDMSRAHPISGSLGEHRG